MNVILRNVTNLHGNTNLDKTTSSCTCNKTSAGGPRAGSCSSRLSHPEEAPVLNYQFDLAN